VIATTAAPAATVRARSARGRRPVALAVLLALVVVAALASIAVGSRSIGLGEVWRALVDGGLHTDEAVIVRRLRVPRTALGLLVGLALGVAGALMQGHTRNPLGDPGLLGVTAGASLAVVLAIAWLGVTTPAGYVWFAFAGALAGTVAVYAVGSAGRGGPTPVTLALAGAASRPCSTRWSGPSWSATGRPSTASGSGSWARSPAGAPTWPGRWPRSSPSGSCSRWPMPRP
jgi:ABC-type Fe3+-siderophore transport system permease subunit